MKKLLLAASALATLAGPALAADLPSRKEAVLPPPPPPMWTGFYAGLNAGYGFGTNSNSNTSVLGGGGSYATTGGGAPISGTDFYGIAATGALSGVIPMSQAGFIGGGQVGYNYQWGSNLVVGLEADIQGAVISGSGSSTGLGNYFYDSDYNSTAIGSNVINAGVDWMGTVRGRIGYLVTPTMLLFGTGGLTYGGVHANVSSSAGLTGVDDGDAFNAPIFGGGRTSQTLVGWNAGGGFEWMFMQNWSLKAEAIYWDLGNINFNTYAQSGTFFDASNYSYHPAVASGRTNVNFQGVIARAGVNYHFNWGAAPIVAKF